MAFLIKQLRIILIVTREFNQNKLPLQAAGLTFYTILSVVPIVALAFAIAKGFGIEEALNQQISEMFRGQEEVIQQITLFANRMLENTKGGILAVVGIGVLLYTVIRLLSNIENSFNEIWSVAKGRSWIRKFTDYFSIMLLAPIILVMAGSITVLISTEVQNFVAGVDILSVFGPVIFFFIKLIPYTLIWIAFTIVYMIMPNTKVEFKSALIAGIISGTAFQLLEWGYIEFQVGVSRYNAIYGSFAALPLFMVWANFSWLITLVGAEIAYANQYVENIQFEIDESTMSQSEKKIVAIILAQRIFHAFDTGGEAHTARQLSFELDIPFGVTKRILDLLKEAKVLTEIDNGEKEVSCFQPARSVEKMKVSDLLTAMDQVGSGERLQLLKRDESAPYQQLLAHLNDHLKHSSEDQLVKDLPPIILKG